MTDSLFDALGREVAALLAPFAEVAEDPAALDDLLAAAGVIVPAAQRNALVSALTAISVLQTQLDGALTEPSGSIERITAVLDVARQLLDAVRALDTVAGSVPGLAGLGRDLVDVLLTVDLTGRHPVLRSVLALVALLDAAEDEDPRQPVLQNGQVVRNAFRADRFHLDRLADLVRDPAAALRAEYGNTLATTADANAMADRLFPRVVRLLRQLGVSCRYGINPADTTLLADAAPFLDHALIVYADDPLDGVSVEAGVVFTISAADRGDLGLVIQPFGSLTSTTTVGAWLLELSLTAGVNLLAVGRHGFTLLADGSGAEVTGAVSLTLPVPEEGPAFLLGSPTGSRLAVSGVTLRLGTALSEARQSLEISADVTAAELVLDGRDWDGFVGSVLPSDGVHATFTLGVAWSNENGLRLRGSGGLEGTFPVDLTIGPVTLPSVHLAIRADDGRLTSEVSASLVARLGPVTALVDRLGLAAELLARPDRDGNLGPVDVSIGFKPPTGAGLVVDAGAVTGGGFLSFDPARGEYAGALELRFADIVTLKAIGLISTRMPDGSRGFSLLAVLTAEFGTGIQLGLGFTLLAVGGLIGLNRRMDLPALVEGVRSGSIESVAFPKDVIANAPRILSDLNRFFPIEDGTFVIGPMAKIGWGTPTLISVSLGLIIEIPGDIAVLGVVRAALPTADKPLLLLQAQFVGALELSKSRAWFFAKLFQSRILGMTAEGGMGVLVAWGDSKDLIVTVGGFHPAFRPPPLPFPVPDRLAVPLLNRSGQLIRLSGYFAITSNTIQFGGDVEVRLGFSAFRVEGHLGLDGLIQRSPFRFTVHTEADVSLKAFGIGVFTLGLDFTLEGPAPWRAHGRGSIGFLFFSVSANFDITWGEVLDLFLPPVVVLDLLAAELAKPEGWETRLPSGGRAPLVSLRVLPGTDDLVLHPLGSLVITQRAVPLNVRVDRVGGQKASDGRRFTVALPDGSALERVTDTGDRFAMAQYQDMSDAAKLSRPSYETQDAGVELTAKGGALATSRVVRRAVRYELHVIGDDAPSALAVATPVKRFHSVPVFDELRPGASTSRAPLSARVARQKQPFAAQDTVRVDEQRFVVAYLKSNRQAFPPARPGRVRVAATFRSRATAQDALADFVTDDPSLAGRLHVIPAAEAAITPGVPGTWSPAGTLPTPVSTVDSVPLPSGAVLIAGGTDVAGMPTAATALFDPTGDSWAAGPQLGTARQHHTTTALLDGRVLVAGGADTATAEVFDPAARRFTPTAPMVAARHGHSATRLSDGRVLVAGGVGRLTSAELYDPRTGTWTETGSMVDARTGHQAVLLDDGRVLVVGGARQVSDTETVPMAYCELYDPATGEWTPTGTLDQPRAGHQAVALLDHRVLVTGGDAVLAPDGMLDPHSLATAELYDQKTGTWHPAPPMPGGGRSGHRALTMCSGVVLVTGGTTAPEHTAAFRSVLGFDPVAGTWTTLGGLLTGRGTHAMAELADDRVLVAAGTAGTGEVLIP